MLKSFRANIAAALSASIFLLASGDAQAVIISAGDITPDPTTILTSQNLTIGDTGIGSMTINSVAPNTSVHNATGVIGNASGSKGTVTVTGTGPGAEATWLNATSFRVGAQGEGNLRIINWGHVSGGAGTSIIGDGIGSKGIVTVSGTGARLSAETLEVARSGFGALNILATSRVKSAFGRIATQAGSSGAVTVDRSIWDVVRSLGVGGGSGGTGTLDILNQGRVLSESGGIGSNGTVTISGAQSAWVIDRNLGIGGSNGALNILAGGKVTNEDGSIAGVSQNAGGTVTVSGAGSQWLNSNRLTVGGGNGPGTLNILSGGYVDGPGGTLVSNANSVVTISGAGSTLTSGLLIPSGKVNILDGGTVVGAVGTIGGPIDLGTVAGSVKVSGPGSSWTVKGLNLGGSTSTARLDIFDGGRVSARDDVLIGSNVNPEVNSNGAALVSGAGSVLDTRDLVVSIKGIGALNVEKGGIVNVTRFMSLAIAAGSVSTLGFGIGDDGNGTIASGLVNVERELATGSGTSIFDIYVMGGAMLRVGDSFTLVDYELLKSGFAFSNIVDDGFFTDGIFTFQIDFNALLGGTADFGADFGIVATVFSIASSNIPEPSPLALICLGLALLFGLGYRGRASALSLSLQCFSGETAKRLRSIA